MRLFPSFSATEIAHRRTSQRMNCHLRVEERLQDASGHRDARRNSQGSPHRAGGSRLALY